MYLSLSSANDVTIPAKLCKLLGIIIFVDFPSATFSSASNPFIAMIDGVGLDSLSNFIASDLAFCTDKIA